MPELTTEPSTESLRAEKAGLIRMLYRTTSAPKRAIASRRVIAIDAELCRRARD